MKGSLHQRSPGSWELIVDLRRDAFGKRRRKHLTVRGARAPAFEQTMEKRGMM